jgi:hypothetical protein
MSLPCFSEMLSRISFAPASKLANQIVQLYKNKSIIFIIIIPITIV